MSDGSLHATIDHTTLPIKLNLFVFIMGIYLLFSPAHFLTTPDEKLNIRTTMSFIEGKMGAIPPIGGGFASMRGKDGREYAQYGLGLPLVSAPWCALGKWIDPSENTERNHLDTIKQGDQEGTDFLQWWMTILTIGITAMMCVLCFDLFLILGISRSRAIVFTLVLAFCTYTWPHGRTFFTEPLSAFCLIAALWSILKAEQKSPVSWWYLIAGIFWSYAILTRLDSIITLPAAAWLLVVFFNDGKWSIRFSFKRLFLFGIPFIAVLALILAYNVYRFGSAFSTGYEDQPENIRFITPLLVGLHGFLLTPGRSLFLYSPPLIFAIVGIYRLWCYQPRQCVGIGLICAAYLVVLSKWQNWAGGYDWGPRHIYQVTPFLMLFAASCFREIPLLTTSPRRIGWLLFIGFALFVQFLGLGADPVLAIKSLIYPYRQNNPQLIPYIMQFMIYLPHFSNPVLHWQWIVNHGANLLIIKSYSSMLSQLIIPLAMSMLGGWGLYRSFKKEIQPVSKETN